MYLEKINGVFHPITENEIRNKHNRTSFPKNYDFTKIGFFESVVTNVGYLPKNFIKRNNDGELYNFYLDKPNNEGFFDVDEDSERDFLIKRLNDEISNLLNKTSREFGYDSIVSVRSYVGFENEYQEECIKLANWSVECWKKSVFLIETIKKEDISNISINNLINEIPRYK